METSRRTHTLYKFGIIYNIIRLACPLIRHYISAVKSLGVFAPFVWINSARRFPYALSL
jgi:hypothetical protein